MSGHTPWREIKHKADQHNEPATTQKSLKGAEIPVPKRSDLLDAFKRIVQHVEKTG